MKSQILKKKLDLNKMTISTLGSSEMMEIKGGGGSAVCNTDYSCRWSCHSRAAFETFETFEYECQCASCRACPI